ncbi:prepilin peptidase [Candidatus Woesearchaeota archaeon]|nr:prepilin peptidase [Candidatus Woesearchaeota archaeon]
MIPTDVFLAIIGFAALIPASVHDIRTREVPDWISYGLIIAGFGIRIIHSLVFSDVWYFLYGLVGFVVMLALGLIMYYSKQWGGGDAKLITGLGVVFASTFDWNNFLISFSFNMLVFGALYGICWSAYLAFNNKDKFFKSFSKDLKKKRNARLVSLIFGLIALASVLLLKDPNLMFIICVAAFSFVVYIHLQIFVKSVEECCMYKTLPVSRLTEGDWVAEPVYVKGKLICGPKDLGLEKEQITVLKKSKVKNVLVKEGIPFVPSFLIAAISTLAWGNLLLVVI